MVYTHGMGMYERVNPGRFNPVNVAPPPTGPVAAATAQTGPGMYSSPEEAYQKTGIAGYGKTFQQLLAERDANQGKASQMTAAYGGNDAQGQYTAGTATGYQPTWQDMAAFESSWDAGNQGVFDPRYQGLIKKVGTWDALRPFVNLYSYNPTAFAGFKEANPNWNYSYGGSLQDLYGATLLPQGYVGGSPGQAWLDWVKGGKIVPTGWNGSGSFAAPTNNPPPNPTPVNPPQNNGGPPSPTPIPPVNTGFQPTGPGYTFQNRNIGMKPLQTGFQPMNINPNQFNLGR